MTDVYTLLSFPTSSALKDYRNTEFKINFAQNVTTPLDTNSPPRKTPRLDADSDSASASRSRLAKDTAFGGSGEKKGRVAIQIAGPPLPQYTDRQFDQDFILVKRALHVLFTVGDVKNNAFPATHQRIFNACRVCVAQKGDGLFDHFRLELEKCVGKIASELRGEHRKGVQWIVPFVEACEWFERQVRLTEDLFGYLDRVYIHAQPGSPSIRSLCYAAFFKEVSNDSAVAERLRVGIEAWLTTERTNGLPHELRPDILKLISRLQYLDQYDAVFVSHYLTLTTRFYTSESETKLGVADALKFLVYCHERRDEEMKRAREVVPIASWQKIREATDKALLNGKLQWLVDGAMNPLMKAMDEKELSQMFKLFKAVDGLKVFLSGWADFIEAKVKEIVADKDGEEDMVPRLREFKSFIDRLVNDALADSIPAPVGTTAPVPTTSASSTKTLASTPVKSEDMDVDLQALSAPSPTLKRPNKEFQYALSDAFRRGFKARRNKPAEMLAKHLDKAMRRGQQGRKDEEFQEELDSVLGLYRFTDDKDVFRTFYHKALAKRLLLDKSASDDFEKAMLKKLKDEYDPEFSMGDHMFNDLALSRDRMREYHTYRARQGDEPSLQKLNAMVLQRSFWPFAARKTDVDLPPQMQSELTKYGAFYKMKHQGHKLDWDHSLGTVSLRARFNKGEKELSVSLYQALVLLLFDDDEQLAFVDIKERTRMENSELRRTLQSLALGKKRVLKKQPMSKEVQDGDVFVLNVEFQDPALRVHINSIQVKETAEESKKTQSLIESDRKHVLDAAIVRIMKAKKELHNEQLKAATIDAVKNHFVPNVNMIKDRIDELVEQEYLKRHEADMNVFVYVA